jgi:hypothetical protein
MTKRKSVDRGQAVVLTLRLVHDPVQVERRHDDVRACDHGVPRHRVVFGVAEQLTKFEKNVVYLPHD